MMAKAPESRPTLDDVRAGFARAVEQTKKAVRASSTLGEEETPAAQVGTMETVHAYTTPVAVEPPRPMRWIVPSLAVLALGGGVAAFLLTRGDDAPPPEKVPTPTPAVVNAPDAAVEVVAPPDAAPAQVAEPAAEPAKKRAKKDRRRSQPDPRVTTPKPPTPPPPPPPDDDAPMEPK